MILNSVNGRVMGPKFLHERKRIPVPNSDELVVSDLREGFAIRGTGDVQYPAVTGRGSVQDSAGVGINESNPVAHILTSIEHNVI